MDSPDKAPYRPISIHAPREGGDRQQRQLLPPVQCISIHAPREGGDIGCNLLTYCGYISIHAPREGGDDCEQYWKDKNDISIHAPREGGDFRLDHRYSFRTWYFNPRPPRGGRHGKKCHYWADQDFNPRPPRGGRQLSYRR